MTEYRNIERLFNVVNRSLFTINGKLDYDRLTDAITRLANVIKDTYTDENVWYIGEGGETTLDGLIVGAFWHYTEWHGGQNSKGYAALSALGEIFNPGMSSGPETDSSESSTYESLEYLADQFFNQGVTGQ